jgi:hypothetical protein
MLRHRETAYISQCVAGGFCCAIVGVSNTGKSRLLRQVARQTQDNGLVVYIDLNLMLEMTEQGFYELVLRSIRDRLAEADQPGDLLDDVRRSYHTLVSPPTAFQIALSFNEGMTAVANRLGHRLVLLLDEFDAPFRELEGRVLLNLRALKDKYGSELVYVTATNRRMDRMRGGRDVSEFTELFTRHTRFLGPLSDEDAHQVLAELAEHGGFTFDAEDLAFVQHQSGGHLGLMVAIAQVLGEVTGEPERDAMQDWLIHRQVTEQLDQDLNVKAECNKLWSDLPDDQQDALLMLMVGEARPNSITLDALQLKGVLKAGSEPLPFSPLFEVLMRRLARTHHRRPVGVRVDVDSGDVWVDGQLTPTLTDLEYRLMLLLYGRINKVCDKYQIVEAVWGEEYIDQVDDARIDKLMSRLRSKIEPDPKNPRYIVTLRGRGYKLVSP